MHLIKTGLIAAAVSMAAMAPAQATDFPKDTVRLVIPYTPGGGADTLGRLVADPAGKQLGRDIIVENKPGANTMLATNYVARTKNDGYTLLYASSSFTINPHVYKTDYDPVESFEPVSLLSEIPLIMVTTKDSPIESVADLVEKAQKNPGTLTYGSYGLGSAAHLAGALFESMGKLQLLHVPYKGSAPAVNDLMGKHVDLAIVSLEAARELVNNKSLKPLAIFNENRLKSMPDIPTVHETIPGCVTVGWNAILAPKGTPQDVVARLNESFSYALTTDRLKEQFRTQGLEPNPQGPEALEAMIRNDNERWSRVVKEANIKIDQ